jgi:RNA polymerase sigma-70 factor (ECF subfamily)
MEHLSAFDRTRAVWLARHIVPHEQALRVWLQRMRYLPLDSDDVIQESYAILAALDSVDHIGNPKAYLFATAKSLVLRDLRRAKIVSIVTVDDLEVLGAAADDPSPERQASDRQELRRLVELVEDLPRQRRDIFKLRKIDGLSQKEIAQRLGVSEKAVEKHLAKAVHLLMDALGRGGKPAPRASIVSDRQSEHVANKAREQS